MHLDTWILHVRLCVIYAQMHSIAILQRSGQDRAGWNGRSGVVRWSFGDRSAQEKKHLIEAAPFGRLDRMLRTAERRRKKKCLIEAAPCGCLDQMPRTTVKGGDTSYYNVWSPSPSRPARGTWPVDQKHDLNLTDLTWPDFQGFLTSFGWLFGFKNVTFSL